MSTYTVYIIEHAWSKWHVILENISWNSEHTHVNNTSLHLFIHTVRLSEFLRMSIMFSDHEKYK